MNNNNDPNRDKAALVRDLIERIQSKRFDIEELYAEFHDSWSEFYLDELALVVAGETIDKGGVYDDTLYTCINELSYLFDESALKLLLQRKWIPLLQSSLDSSTLSWNDQKLFKIIHQNNYLKLLVPELRQVLFPFIRDLVNATRWVILLEYNLSDSIELLQETISEAAPQITAGIKHISNHDKIIAICLKIWAPTATVSDLSKISLQHWAEFGLTEAQVCDIFASALSTKWPLGEMVARYTILSNYGLPPNATLEKAMVYTLNCINGVLDRSNATPLLSYPTKQISLEDLLLNWCAEMNLQPIPDPQDRRKYTISSTTKSVVVSMKDNVFWINEQPIELDRVRNFLF